VELKSVSKITNNHKAQVLNYLAATGINKSINFHAFPKAKIIRIVSPFGSGNERQDLRAAFQRRGIVR
jgi:hypothetical protein